MDVVYSNSEFRIAVVGSLACRGSRGVASPAFCRLPPDWAKSLGCPDGIGVESDSLARVVVTARKSIGCTFVRLHDDRVFRKQFSADARWRDSTCLRTGSTNFDQ